jgi:hypothetical protein
LRSRLAFSDVAGVLADAQHALDVALGHSHEHRQVGVVADDLRVPIVAEIVVGGGGGAIHGFEI